MPKPNLELPRATVQRVLDGQSRMSGDPADVKQRFTALEIQLGDLTSTEQSHYASLAPRLDRYDTRIERTPDLADAPET